MHQGARTKCCGVYLARQNQISKGWNEEFSRAFEEKKCFISFSWTIKLKNNEIYRIKERYQTKHWIDIYGSLSPWTQILKASPVSSQFPDNQKCETLRHQPNELMDRLSLERRLNIATIVTRGC